ncbi:hypothetical protein, partial [Rhizobium sp. IMFF44]|uniref:hypothetical protein n=1 Tax=Rhizobium sp. IMFF44 TaxID=3342350 RepID=UPI0035B8830F
MGISFCLKAIHVQAADPITRPASFLNGGHRLIRRSDCQKTSSKVPATSIQHDAADAFARMHELEALVDILERHGV